MAMSKPKVGRTVWEEKTGYVLGEVIENIGNICLVRTPDGDSDRFIWKFKDGLNTRFGWEGKNDEHN